ncbi:lectin C-type domain protein [Teladorsagia circumcincta]|uniref:Lectin C-type domain protein n=1 Tax=Teladorsagia circumcincta TaxID=45464 RepID=A0A2G9U617_TELCI|nr:lectin C-type domain protein [Teladorsagia circumcincta]
MAFTTCVFALLNANPELLPRLGKYCESELCHVKMTDLTDCEFQCESGTFYPNLPGHHGRPPHNGYGVVPPGPIWAPQGPGGRRTDPPDTFGTPNGRRPYNPSERPPPIWSPEGHGGRRTDPPYTFGPYDRTGRPSTKPPDRTDPGNYYGPHNDGSRPPKGYKVCEITGYSYKHVKTPSTWYEARAACRADGAELASIHSWKENEFIYNLVKNERKQIRNPYNTVWIGGRRNAYIRGFMWSDESPFSFTYWAKGEPNNYGGQENCVSFYNRRIDCYDEWRYLKHWNDLPCNRRLRDGYVCKKRVTRQVITPAKGRRRRSLAKSKKVVKKKVVKKVAKKKTVKS